MINSERLAKLRPHCDQESISGTNQESIANNGNQNQDSDWQSELDPKYKFKKLWQGWDGAFIMTFGVTIPALLFLAFNLMCIQRLVLVSINHPFETLAEWLLAANIPATICATWYSLRANTNRYSLKNGINMGAAIGACLIVMAVAVCGVTARVGCETNMSMNLAWFALTSLAAAVTGSWVVVKVWRTRDFSSSRNRVVMYTIFGIALSALIFLGAEAAPWSIRQAEIQAASSSIAEQRAGFAHLRSLFPERQMLIECSDSRAAGLCGLFLPLTSDSQKELYFAITGEPFSFRDVNNKDLASISDDCLTRQVVGDRIAGLSLLRSAISGTLHPETLTATIRWSFVFKNSTTIGETVRAVVAIPQNAVVTGATYFWNGQMDNAVLSDQAISPSLTTGGNYACTVNNLGHGRILLSCSEVPSQNESKLCLTTVVPMQPDGAQTAVLSLPRIMAANFDLFGEHSLRLRSNLAVSSAMENLKIASTATGEKLIVGTLGPKDLMSSDLMVTSVRTENPQAVVAASHLASNIATDRNIRQKKYIRQSVVPIPASVPKQLVLVIDGSKSLEKHRQELIDSLSMVPSSVPTSVIIASGQAGASDEAIPLCKAIQVLRSCEFIGGQDNLRATIKAASVAGECQESAVLWIHGPQPALNREIYIAGDCESRPRFYELAIDGGIADANEYFRNYSEIGPFQPVVRNGDLTSSLRHFFSKWQPGSIDYSVRMATIASCQGVKVASDQAAHELEVLWASYAHNNDNTSAGRYGTISTIVQQKPNATYITGVNTAGTLRINNLANLEALLNIIANVLELSGIIAGSAISARAFLKPKDRVMKLGTGIALILIGLFAPGAINWLVASARDANLFS